METTDYKVTKKLLKALSGQIDGFYLAGGTALSMAYYQHRESYDVDLFTRKFSTDRINRIVRNLKKACKAEMEVIEEQLRDDAAKRVVYKIAFAGGAVCKFDFIEETFDRINPLRSIDGIHVLSLEDIYLRKIYAISGYIKSQNIIGREIMLGGRQEAKDFYDLYCLSSISIPLSQFVFQYGGASMREGLVRWHRTYDRLAIKSGLLDLITKREIDTRQIEKHFDGEMDKLLIEEVEG